MVTEVKQDREIAQFQSRREAEQAMHNIAALIDGSALITFPAPVHYKLQAGDILRVGQSESRKSWWAIYLSAENTL